MDLKLIGIIVGLVLVLIMALVLFNFFGLWFQALMSKADVSLVQLLGMRFRKVPAKVIVEAKIMGIKAGLVLGTEELEAHYMAGGHVQRVVQALIAADKANITLSFKRAAAIDLAGRNVLEAVQTSVDPKVIDCPDPKQFGRTTLDGVAKNGIQLRAKARVTVRTKLDRIGEVNPVEVGLEAGQQHRVERDLDERHQERDQHRDARLAQRGRGPQKPAPYEYQGFTRRPGGVW